MIEDQEIYPDYAERFSHTFPALVRVVLNHILNGNLSVNIISMILCICTDVCPCPQAATTGQCPRQAMAH